MLIMFKKTVTSIQFSNCYVYFKILKKEIEYDYNNGAGGNKGTD